MPQSQTCSHYLLVLSIVSQSVFVVQDALKKSSWYLTNRLITSETCPLKYSQPVKRQQWAHQSGMLLFTLLQRKGKVEV